MGTWLEEFVDYEERTKSQTLILKISKPPLSPTFELKEAEFLAPIRVDVYHPADYLRGVEQVQAENLPVVQVYNLFKESVSTIPQVRYIAAWAENEVIHFWTIIPRRDREVQHRIYDKELELMRKFKALDFDFNVIFCSEADVSSILPSEAEIIYKRG
jgi:hypothetical protein